ncbi:SAV_2336 N-terminal domain-related protein [Streptomyces sp. NBC_01306]|uniref:SAV_2336 N-terminal domain-related protein n=1 Tax=Streptomyces sp. NBC_01306 TaxID=2903819 RepID=UPI002252D911|nr:SAV_2336 N-terminal domain-related protein [Streptomyces sp. NBC_01306]MCX4723804.1 SAV_2336 N-terminal domain-related protein [Streptomyces sp. NBC_01306]
MGDGRDESGRGVALTTLVARLRESGRDVDARELADALWLAARTGAPAPAGPGLPAGLPQETPAAPPAAPTRPVEPPGDTPGAPAALLTAPDPEGAPAAVEASPVLVPAAPALADPHALQRALRPLSRYRSPAVPPGRRLDEEATAGRAADTGLVIPVLRAARRQKARLLLLMDVSTSTVAWESALEELAGICAGAGVFQDVQLRYLHPDGESGAGYAAGRVPAGPLRRAAQLGDPTGRRIILLLSDCSGPMWRSGVLQRLLYHWSATTPVAVVQPLPQRLWRRTHLPAYGGVLRRHEGPLGRLEFSAAPHGSDPRDGRPVPVLALRRTSVEGWAGLVSGGTGQSVSTAAAWVRRDQPPSRAPVRAEAALTGQERVGAFRRTASPTAQRLAEYLTAVPLVLPVMRLVQHTMLAGTGPEALAEVLLGGIVRRAERPDIGPSDGPYYEFLDGVKVLLAARLDRGDERLVLRHSSSYVQRRFGRSARNFPAMAAVALGERLPVPAGGGAMPAGLRVFAEVAADTIRRRGGPPVAPPGPGTPGELTAQADEFIQRYERFGGVRDLDSAIGLLRLAAAGERRRESVPARRAELSRALLLRWRLRALDEDLAEAWESAKSSDGFAAAEVLHAMAVAADEGQLGQELAGKVLREVRGPYPGDAPLDDADTAAELLSAASDRLRGVTEAVRPSQEWPAAAALHIEVLRRLSRAGGPAVDTTPLYAAAALAERLADTADGVGARVLHGTLELDLARHVVSDDVVRHYALRALRALRPAAAEATGGAERADIWLKIASALELAHLEGGDASWRWEVLDALAAALAAADDDAVRHHCHLRMGDVHWQGHIDPAAPALPAAVRPDSVHPAAGRPDSVPLESARPDSVHPDSAHPDSVHPESARPEGSRGESARPDSAHGGAPGHGQGPAPRPGIHLDGAIEHWAAALATGTPDRPARLLTRLGRALGHRAARDGAPGDLDAAVRRLREAVDETAESDRELAARRALLGALYLARYRATGGLTDLYEADWAQGAAARGAPDPYAASRAWQARGDIAVLLARHTGTPDRLQQAAEHYLRATDVDDDGRAGAARAARAAVLEELAGPPEALREYRAALALLESAGPAGDSAAAGVRDAVARLTDGAAGR